MPRRVVKHLATPRKVLYLYGLLAVSWLISGYFIFERVYLDAKDKSQRQQAQHESSFNERVQQDAHIARLAYDDLFNPDEAIREHRVGQTEQFLNVCDKATCKIMSGTEPSLNLCNNALSTAREFHKYRVYSCGIKVTLDNDQPMDCLPVTWSEFKDFCAKVNNS